jgi:FecR protein
VTEGTAAAGATSALAVGPRVMHNERIHTSPSGSVQVLFLDKSTLNIAPDTNLLIDEFVYDPAATSEHMLTKLTQGTLQYIGGKLSHRGVVTISTPAAAVGVRGGTGTIIHGANGTQVINQYGTMTITNAAGTVLLTRPGFAVTVRNWNTTPGQPIPITAAQVDRNIKYLSSKAGQNGGVPGLTRLAHAKLNCASDWTSRCHESTWQPNNDGRLRRFADHHPIDAAGDATDAAADYSWQLNPPNPICLL